MLKSVSNIELRQARDERVQQRITSAYVEMLTFVYQVSQWATLVHPLMTSGEVDPPALPTLPDQARIRALVAAFASDDARQLMKQWDAVLLKVRVAVMTIDTSTDRKQHGGSGQESWGKLEADARVKLGMELLPAEAAAREALGGQMAAELEHPLASSDRSGTLRGAVEQAAYGADTRVRHRTRRTRWPADDRRVCSAGCDSK